VSNTPSNSISVSHVTSVIHTSPDGTTCELVRYHSLQVLTHSIGGSRSHPRPRIAIGDLSHGERYSNVEDEIGARLAVASAALPCVPSVICVWHWKVMCDALSPRISTAHVNTISPDDPGTSYTHAGLHLAASTGEAPTSERVH
jgi:hypothetical protein